MPGVVPGVSFSHQDLYARCSPGGEFFLTRINTPGVAPGVSFSHQDLYAGCSPGGEFSHQDLYSGCSPGGEFFSPGFIRRV